MFDEGAKRIDHADSKAVDEGELSEAKNHDNGFKEVLSQTEGMGRPTQ